MSRAEPDRSEDTLPRLVRLTPRGRGAVAALRLEGPGAIAAVEPFFVRLGGEASAAEGLREIGRARYGRWRRAPGEENALAEDVVLCQVEPGVVEIHCHGGEQAPTAIIDTLIASGRASLVEPHEEIERRFPEGWRREAFEQLQYATAPLAARILWDQFRGAWPRMVKQLTSAASDADSPEAAIDSVRRSVERALSFERLGTRLVEPWRIVLAGPPNVGKSSLVNRLVGYERSIAFDQPGTTRDVLVVRSVLAGLPVEFSDTAGLRESSDELEAEGIARTRQAVASADLVLLLADASGPWLPEYDELLRSAPAAILVHHKRDLAPVVLDDRPAGLAVSSLTGAGVDDLLREIERRILPTTPETGEFVPIDEEQVAELRRSLDACDEGLDAVRQTLDAFKDQARLPATDDAS
jgi:tRNA modification GTPase